MIDPKELLLCLEGAIIMIVFGVLFYVAIKALGRKIATKKENQP